nr:SCP extracellular domain containing protein [Haemonchus contortus]
MRPFIHLVVVIGLCFAELSHAPPSGAMADAPMRTYPTPPDGAVSGHVSDGPSEHGHEKRAVDPMEQAAVNDRAMDGERDFDAIGHLSRNKRQAYCNGRYSQTDRDAILKFHNDMRSKIARGQYLVRGQAKPSAVNMRKLYYSCDLENSAQNVANRCNTSPGGTKPCKSRCSDRRAGGHSYRHL